MKLERARHSCTDLLWLENSIVPKGLHEAFQDVQEDTATPLDALSLHLSMILLHPEEDMLLHMMNCERKLFYSVAWGIPIV